MHKAPIYLATEYNEDLPGSPLLNFSLSSELEAGEPPEARGLARDEVRLMVSHISTDQIVHTHFRQIGDFLKPGDVLVINTSGTMNAAIPATRADGLPLELHLSTHLPADLWVVELRVYHDKTTRPFRQVQAGETLDLPGGGIVTLHVPYHHGPAGKKSSRLWIATMQLPDTLEHYLSTHGHTIHYSYVREQWPAEYYQTAYVTEVGSAEMPSAGRAFTPEIITGLIAHGVQVVPLLLHTGVSSLEEHEPPYEEYYRVPPTTARVVNIAREEKRRVIAVGTTVVRALETVTDADGTTYPGDGWTTTIITPGRGLHAVNGLLTGLHEPQATHLLMLTALANREHLRIAYREALSKEYLWHEFGDLHLILP